MIDNLTIGILGLGLAGVGLFLAQSEKPNPENRNSAPGSGSPRPFTLNRGLLGDPNLNELYQLHGNVCDVDWYLLKAIAIVESNESVTAQNKDGSTGLMQVLCIPDGKGGCSNNFPAVSNWSIAKSDANALFDPDYNINVACQILKWNIDNYGFMRGIAVYNNWGARNDPPEGPFRNQGYVNDVFAAYDGLAGGFAF